MNISAKIQGRMMRRKRVRAKVFGTPKMPRLSVFKSNRYMYAEVIDDTLGHTLAAATSMKEKVKGLKAAAEFVGGDIAKKAVNAGIKKVSFDRGGYRYTGAVRILADAALKGGLEF
jgi:large subunit ribosomal protein L18